MQKRDDVSENEDKSEVKDKEKNDNDGNGKDKEDEFDGWYYRNGTPLSSSIPAYFVKP